jgi:negative regulator of flagellin synthesis FlgM
MSNSIDGIRGIPNHPGLDGQVQNKASGSEDSSKDKVHIGPVAVDTVALTDVATRVKEAEKVLADTPDVDQARVARIKAAIADGSYDVNPSRIADKMLRLDDLIDQIR